MAETDEVETGRFEQHLVIAADPRVVFNCFFSPDALRAWWQAVRSVTTPVPLGVYAIEWSTTSSLSVNAARGADSAGSFSRSAARASR